MIYYIIRKPRKRVLAEFFENLNCYLKDLTAAATEMDCEWRKIAMNINKIFAGAIANEYTPQKDSKVVAQHLR